MPHPSRLGVDFGTSHTVAMLHRDGAAVPLLFDSSPILPSGVYAHAESGLSVGTDARNAARLDPSRFEPNPKRRIDDGHVLLGDNEFSVTDLFGEVLEQVRRDCERVLGAAPGSVTLTHPAVWGSARRLILEDAASAAGFHNARLVPEPVAAATYFTQVLRHELPSGSGVMVADLGGGTFDASVVANTPNGYEVLAVDGIENLGGVDFDHALVTLLGERYADRPEWATLMDPATTDHRRARRALYEDVRAAKEQLSRQTRADLPVPLLGTDTHITRDELEHLTRPLLDRAVRVTLAVRRASRLPEERLSGVLLVGGGSRMPLVASMLHEATGVAPIVLEQPELVVAQGATLHESPATASEVPGPRATQDNMAPSAESQPAPAGAVSIGTSSAQQAGPPGVAASQSHHDPRVTGGPAPSGPYGAATRGPQAPARSAPQPAAASPPRPPAAQAQRLPGTVSNARALMWFTGAFGILWFVTIVFTSGNLFTGSAEASTANGLRQLILMSMAFALDIGVLIIAEMMRRSRARFVRVSAIAVNAAIPLLAAVIMLIAIGAPIVDPVFAGGTACIHIALSLPAIWLLRTETSLRWFSLSPSRSAAADLPTTVRTARALLWASATLGVVLAMACGEVFVEAAFTISDGLYLFNDSAVILMVSLPLLLVGTATLAGFSAAALPSHPKWIRLLAVTATSATAIGHLVSLIGVTEVVGDSDTVPLVAALAITVAIGIGGTILLQTPSARQALIPARKST
ncbi:MAG: Hsp70 family protein [Stackebrandtia sp.]